MSNTGTSTVENQYNTPPPPSPISAPGVDNSLGSSSNADESQTSFSALCQPSNLGKNWNPCKSHCEPYECCFAPNPNDSCYNNDKAKCDEYAICKEFFVDTPGVTTSSGSSSISGPSSVANSGFSADTQDDMESLCNLNLDQNLDACKSWCLPYECCFTFSNSCMSSQPQECDDHAICNDVFDALKRNPNSATGGVTPVSNNAQDNTFSSNAVSNPVSINNSPQVPAQNSAQTAVQDLAESELISLAKACNDDQLEINDSECLRICQGSACKFFLHIFCSNNSCLHSVLTHYTRLLPFHPIRLFRRIYASQLLQSAHNGGFLPRS